MGLTGRHSLSLSLLSLHVKSKLQKRTMGNQTYNKQECIPTGCVPSAAVAISWGGGLPGRGVSACQKRVSARGCLPDRGGCLPCRGVYTSPPRGQTDAYENITFPQLLLRTVMKPTGRQVIGMVKKIGK